MKICVTGSAGLIMGYLVQELLENREHLIVGVDNFSKYGEITRSYDGHPRYRFIQGDAKNMKLLKSLLSDCDMLVAAGCSYRRHILFSSVCLRLAS